MLRYLLLFLIVASPAYATGYTNPEFSGRVFKKVLVTVPVDDQKFRDEMESRTLEYMQKYVTTTGVRSVDLFPPFLEVDEASYVPKLKDSGIEAVVVILPKDTASSFPPLFKNKSKIFSMRFVDTRWQKDVSTSVTVYDALSGKIAWTGTFDIDEKGKKIIKEISIRTVRVLRDSRLLEEKK